MIQCRKHEWKLYVENEIAVFEKMENGPPYRAIGDISFCLCCGTLFIFPHRQDLRPVEVEIAWPADGEAA